MSQLLARRTDITEEIIEGLRNWRERILLDHSDGTMGVTRINPRRRWNPETAGRSDPPTWDFQKPMLALRPDHYCVVQSGLWAIRT
jgi:hypothetical protein